MLSDNQIDDLCCEWLYVAPGRTYEEHRPFARAIESAACAERDARIAELERLMSEDHSHALDLAAEIERMTKRLEEARKDAADADSMCEAMKKVIDQNDARWKFLHTTNKDSEGFEWCVLRVKWENGRISEALHTYSNMADLDAAIKEDGNGNAS